MRASDHIHAEVWTGRCQQLFDSALPTGAYAHSQGLEGLVQSGEVTDADGLVAFLEAEVGGSFAAVEVPFFRRAHEAVSSGQWQELTMLDDLVRATRPSHELRQAATRVGRQTWRLYQQILPDPSPERAQLLRCGEFISVCQSTVVSGCIAACLGIPCRPALLAYGRQTIAGYVQAAVKLLNLGPTTVQGILYRVGEQLPRRVDDGWSLRPEETGFAAPRWDIASARHQFAERRLFIS